MGNSRGGYVFTNDKPEITFEPTKSKSVLKKTVNLDRFNSDVRGWGKKVVGQLRQATSSFPSGKNKSHTYRTGIHSGKREGKLNRSLGVRYSKERGGEQIETIGFKLERHGVFVQKGVGSGYVATGGHVARIAKTDDPAAYRFPENWFNKTLDRNINSLSNIVVKHTGDAIVLNTKRMFIQ